MHVMLDNSSHVTTIVSPHLANKTNNSLTSCAVGVVFVVGFAALWAMTRSTPGLLMHNSRN
jgi:hypothetical protein